MHSEEKKVQIKHQIIFLLHKINKQSVEYSTAKTLHTEFQRNTPLRSTKCASQQINTKELKGILFPQDLSILSSYLHYRQETL